MANAKTNAFEFRIARQTLLDWHRSRSPIDRVVQNTLREHQVGAAQRGPISQAVYTMIRGWPFLTRSDFTPENPDSLRVFEENLRLAFTLEPERLLQLHERAKPAFDKSPLDHLARVHGLPSFMLTDVGSRYDLWHDYLHTSQFTEAPLTLRANTLKIEPAALVERLKVEAPSVDIELSPWIPECLRVKGRYPLHLGAAFKEGLFEIQDEHSQLVSRMLLAGQDGAKEPIKVLDLCAGAGGKSLHLSALLKGKSEIFAYDLIRSKRSELRQRAQRANAMNIRVLDDLTIKEKFDFVLVDAPCSSLGTLRRNPDRLLHFRPEEARQLVSIQSDLLLRGLEFLKPGGKLMYVTCTLRSAENTTLIDSVLSERKNRRIPIKNALKAALNLNTFDAFLTALSSSPSHRLLDELQASMCLQPGPSSQASGGLIGDAFFMALIE